jgi:hypothetical protein
MDEFFEAKLAQFCVCRLSMADVVGCCALMSWVIVMVAGMMAVTEVMATAWAMLMASPGGVLLFMLMKITLILFGHLMLILLLLLMMITVFVFIVLVRTEEAV